jgi:hypothetical protein
MKRIDVTAIQEFGVHCKGTKHEDWGGKGKGCRFLCHAGKRTFRGKFLYVRRSILYVTHIYEFVTANKHIKGKILISIQWTHHKMWLFRLSYDASLKSSSNFCLFLRMLSLHIHDHVLCALEMYWFDSFSCQLPHRTIKANVLAHFFTRKELRITPPRSNRMLPIHPHPIKTGEREKPLYV